MTVSVRKNEIEKAKGAGREEGREGGQKKREREGRWGSKEKCGGSVSASDKSISLPPVGQNERLTLRADTAHINKRTSLCRYQLNCLGREHKKKKNR